jgi:hypothetical protein
VTFFRPKSVGPLDLALSEIKGAGDRCATAVAVNMYPLSPTLMPDRHGPNFMEEYRCYKEYFQLPLAHISYNVHSALANCLIVYHPHT